MAKDAHRNLSNDRTRRIAGNLSQGSFVRQVVRPISRSILGALDIGALDLDARERL